VAGTEDVMPDVHGEIKTHDSPPLPEDPEAVKGVAKPDGNSRKSRKSIAERVTTTQGILTLTITLVTLIFGGGSLAAAAKGLMGPGRLVLTDSQAATALLAPQDVAIIDSHLTPVNVAIPTSTACNKLNATQPQPVLEETRDLSDQKTYLLIGDDISAYRSPADAQKALTAMPEQISCGYKGTGAAYSLTGISSEFNGLCAGNESWMIKSVSSPSSSVTAELMAWASIRCGSNLLSVWVTGPQDGSSIHGDLDMAVEVAVAKVKPLPGS
jgi:hypothetical protein